MIDLSDYSSFTVDDVIKALKLCISSCGCGTCVDCPLSDVCRDDPFAIEKASLYVILRLKSEHENLNKFD